MTAKTSKIILLAVIFSAIVIPLTIMGSADAANNIGKTVIKNQPQNSDIPLFDERQTLFKTLDSLENESNRANVEKQIEVLNAKIQTWYDERFDQAKYDLAIKSKTILRENLKDLQSGKGDMEAYEILPWVTRGYDYENNALEVRIDSKYFTEENIPKYIKTIRSLVGDEVDITVGPGEMRVAEACTSRSTSECEPIQGGVRVEADNAETGTVGYKATYNSKTGFITAGHMFVDSSGNQRAGTTIQQHPASTTDIGNLETNNLFKGVATWCDCAFVSELSATRSMSNGVYGMTTPTTTANPFVNMGVTMSGGFTGTSSGSVTNINLDYCYDLDGNGSCETAVNDAIVASYSSQGGDSGSPIMSGNTLVGMHVASSGTFMKHNAVTNSFPGLTWGF